jgi:hypothetical protein
MRRLALPALALLAAGCASAPAPEAAPDGTLRLLVAGPVDLGGPAAAVAEADQEGLFREARLLARTADVAVIVAVSGGRAAALLSAAGFDVVACPRPRLLGPGPTATVSLRCAGIPGLASAVPGSLAVELSTGSLAFRPLAAEVRAAVARGSFPVAVPHTLLGRARLTVSGLGMLLSGDAAAAGALLEVLADGDGVIAYRLGRVSHTDYRVHFAGWDLPQGNAVLLGGEWWALARPALLAPARPPPEGLVFSSGDLVAAAVGDVTGDGVPDLAASYRHPFRPSALSEARPGVVGIDSLGRSSHLGVFTLEGEALWAAGYMPRPVGRLAACDGAVALAFTRLDDPVVVAAGAGIWRGLSLEAAPELPGGGLPGCADVDGDGRLDPVILGRTR